MSNNKFSIIVRIYNAAKYLNQCIESVISQTYSNWELVLVNDGSTDSSLQICESFASKDERIKVVSQENQGGVAAQLAGFDNATGDYICSLDADDWYDNNLLEICNKYFENNTEIDLLLFGYKCFYENNSTSLFSLTSDNKVLNTNDLVSFVMTTTTHALWLKVFKRQLINYTDYEKQLLDSDGKKFRFNNDLFLCIPLLFNSKEALITNEHLYNYRILSNSSSHKKNPYKRIEISFNTMNYLYQIFKEKKFINSESEYLIAKEIYREILPEFYNLIRHFQSNKQENKTIKMNPLYSKLLQIPEKKEILKSFNFKQRIAFFLFTKVL